MRIRIGTSFGVTFALAIVLTPAASEPVRAEGAGEGILCGQMTDQDNLDSVYRKWHGKDQVYSVAAGGTQYWNWAHDDIRGGYAPGPNIGHTDHTNC